MLSVLKGRGGLITGTSALAVLAASMAAGTWASLTATNADAVIGVGNPQGGDAQNVLPYCGTMPWDATRKKIVVMAADHGYVNDGSQGQTPHSASRYMEWDDATNYWNFIGDLAAYPNTHGFQHTTINPVTDDIIMWVPGSSNFAKYNGTYTWTNVTTCPESMGGIYIALALCWWPPGTGLVGAGAQGCMIFYSSNSGYCDTWNPLTNVWTASNNPLTGQNGIYHTVSGYSAVKNCVVFGGGNSSKQLARFDADRSVTMLTLAPRNVGIFAGMSLVPEPVTGNFLCLGAGELWELNPSGAGTWTQQTGSRAPPAGMLDPMLGYSCTNTSIPDYGVVVYTDSLYNRSPTPLTRMWVYKHA